MDKINEEIKRLEEEKFNLMAKSIRNKAIKEFAERLKGLLSLNVRVSNEEYLDIARDIDNLVKQMVGDNDDNE